MERRLKLHEKLKSSTKLNKMTVKQGDILVTLNLKKDIGDPSIEISDKVLYMLEQFVDKQQSKTLSSSISQINTTKKSEVEVTLPQKPATAQTITSALATITASPSKRVRFDLTVKTSDSTETAVLSDVADTPKINKSNEVSTQEEERNVIAKKIIDQNIPKQDNKTSQEQQFTKNNQPQSESEKQQFTQSTQPESVSVDKSKLQNPYKYQMKLHSFKHQRYHLLLTLMINKML